MINEELKFDFTFTYKLNNDCKLYEIAIEANQMAQVFKFVADKKYESELIDFIKTHTNPQFKQLNQVDVSNKKTKIMKFKDSNLILRTLNDDGTKVVAHIIIKGQNNIDNLLSNLLILLENANKLNHSQPLRNEVPPPPENNEPLPMFTTLEWKDLDNKKEILSKPKLKKIVTIPYLINGAIEYFDHINNKLDISIWRMNHIGAGCISFTMELTLEELAHFFAPIICKETRSQSSTEKLLYCKESKMLDIIAINDGVLTKYRIHREVQSISNILNMFRKFLISRFDDF